MKQLLPLLFILMLFCQCDPLTETVYIIKNNSKNTIYVCNGEGIWESVNEVHLKAIKPDSAVECYDEYMGYKREAKEYYQFIHILKQSTYEAQINQIASSSPNMTFDYIYIFNLQEIRNSSRVLVFDDDCNMHIEGKTESHEPYYIGKP